MIALLHGRHLLGHAPDDLLPAVSLGQDLLAGDAVEDGDNGGVRPHQMAAGLDGALQAAEFHGEQQQVHRLRDFSGVRVVEITQLAVEVHAVFLVAFHPGPVRQDQNMVLAKTLSEQVAVQNAQGAQADDAHGFDLFHTHTSLKIR